MIFKTKREIGILLLFFVIGCGGAGQKTTPQMVDQENEEESYLVCELSQDVSSCVVRLDSSLKSRLMNTLKAFGSQGPWTDFLFETKSFQKRYGLTADEKKCIKDMICKKEI
jgi:hypothetical protein